jgi:hypothetical protein
MSAKTKKIEETETQTTEHAVASPKERDMGARIGAIVAGVAFLFIGALPAVLFGGYAGLMLGKAMFGGAESLAVRIVTGGGMVLGLAAVLSLFLVVGAALGSALGRAVRGSRVEQSDEGHDQNAAKESGSL